MRISRSKRLLYGWFVLFAVMLTACTSDSQRGLSEKQQIVDAVMTVEENEYDLVYFNKPYKQYHEAVNEIVSEEYRASMSGEIVFGYDNETYTRDDLANMPQEEYDKHKEHMLNIIRGMGMDKISATVRISDVYAGNQSNQVQIYTIEKKELNNQPFTATTKRYALEKHGDKWLINDVEYDKYTYGSEMKAEELDKGLKGLKYQTHDGEVIDYPTVVVFSGVGGQ